MRDGGAVPARAAGADRGHGLHEQPRRGEREELAVRGRPGDPAQEDGEEPGAGEGHEDDSGRRDGSSRDGQALPEGGRPPHRHGEPEGQRQGQHTARRRSAGPRIAPANAARHTWAPKTARSAPRAGPRTEGGRAAGVPSPGPDALRENG